MQNLNVHFINKMPISSNKYEIYSVNNKSLTVPNGPKHKIVYASFHISCHGLK